MKRPPLPAAHAEFLTLSKPELLRLADDLPQADPVAVDYGIAFVCAETMGHWHGRARAKLCRRLKHLALGRSQREALLACILERLVQGRFSEQFKDQLRLALTLDPRGAALVCEQAKSSPLPHVRRYAAWALGCLSARRDREAARVPISRRCLRLYEAFRGDADGWVRSAEGRGDPALAHAWPAIDAVILKLRLAATVPVGEAFAREAQAALADLTAGDPRLQRELRRIADASRQW
jgi:hypothetical protein